MIIIVNAEPSPPTSLPQAGEGSERRNPFSSNVLGVNTTCNSLSSNVQGEDTTCDSLSSNVLGEDTTCDSLSSNVLGEDTTCDPLSPSTLGERVRVRGGKKKPSTRHALPQQSYLINFLIALGYDPDYTPVAALLASSYSIDKPCLIATPIHWKASHNDVLIEAAGAELNDSNALMRVWCHELNQFLGYDGFHLHYHDCDHWLVVPPDGHLLNAPNVTKMLHQSMMPVLSTLDDSLFWQRSMTEIQMFLAQHPLNPRHASFYPTNERGVARGVQGKGFIFNGLWFWGAGALDKPVNRVIYTDSRIIQNAFPMAKTLDLIDFSDKTAIVVMEQYDPDLLAYFEQQLQRSEVQWILDRSIYTTGVRRSWLRRLWNYLK